MSRLTSSSETWVKSSQSSGDGNCVEVALSPSGVLVRNSKDRTGLVLNFTSSEWGAFVAGARTGEFDLG